MSAAAVPNMAIHMKATIATDFFLEILGLRILIFHHFLTPNYTSEVRHGYYTVLNKFILIIPHPRVMSASVLYTVPNQQIQDIASV